MLDIIIEKAESARANSLVDFAYEIKHDIPSVLRGDDVRIIQVVSGLIGNFLKYSDSGIVSLKVSSQPLSTEKAFLIFKVESNSRQIPKSELDFIYDNVHSMRGTPGRENKEKGTRLALYIVKTIVDRMDGRIAFSSSEEDGAHFTIMIPQRIVENTLLIIYLNQAPLFTRIKFLIDLHALGSFNAFRSKYTINL